MANNHIPPLINIAKRLLGRFLRGNDSYSKEIRRYHDYFLPIGRDHGNEWIRKSASIHGWLFPGEHDLLWKLGLESPPGHILEVGTWMGKSACILAGSCIARKDDSKVFCVDPFDLRGTDWQREFHRRLNRSASSTFEGFIANAHRFGYYREVVPIAKASEDVLSLLALKLRLAFLDGWHDYEHVQLECNLIAPMIVPGGYLALHDVTQHYPGVMRAADELALSREWVKDISAGSIVTFKKR